MAGQACREVWRQCLEEYLAALLAANRAPGTVSDTKSIVSRWIDYALWAGRSPEVFDEDLFETFVGPLDLSENSRRSYTSHIRRWCKWRQSGGEVRSPRGRVARSGHRRPVGDRVSPDSGDVHEVWRQCLEEYLAALRAANRAPGTVSDTKSIVSRWIDYALWAGRSPEVFDEDLFETFVGPLDLSENSRRSYTSHIRGWCKWRQSGRPDSTDGPRHSAPRPSQRPPPRRVFRVRRRYKN